MSWAEHEFARIDLGDQRLNKRTALLAERLANKPAASIPGACQGWAEVQAAYRLFNHEEVDFWSIMEPHIDCTRERMAARKVVLCLQDTTSLDYNGQAIEGLGPMQYEPQKGLFVHPTYAITPEREPLGLTDSWNWARKPRDANGERPAEMTESRRWIDGYERLCEDAALMPNTRLVYIGDRESDLLGLISRADEMGQPVDWLVRAKHNRVLAENKKLFETVLEETPVGEIRFTQPRRPGIKKRPVVQTLYLKPLKLQDKRKKKELPVTCLIAREENPPNGSKAVEWRLLTNRCAENLSQAVELIDWYRARWEIEMYFDILKNGCRVESLQLRHLESLEVALALLMVIAWRINRLMRLGRQMPDLEASLLFEADEIRAAYVLQKKRPPTDRIPTLNEVVRLVAMAGGFLGRKGDGEPGAKTIWQGLDQVMSCAEGIRYARECPDDG